jgi:hypothetical protein
MAWLQGSFAALPGSTDDLFQRLWTNGRLRFEDGARDAVDEYAAQLICAAIARQRNVFLVLPDYMPRRPALLFATALLRDWYDSAQLSAGLPRASRVVLYLGTTVGIRDQLGRVRLQNRTWDLADVFRSRHLTRTGSTAAQSTSGDSSLPTVYTSYAPAAPEELINSLRPSWLAVDCADANRAPWLREALRCAREKGIPTIGWGQNALSECTQDFAECYEVWRWPQRPADAKSSVVSPPANVSVHNALSPNLKTVVQPLVVSGGNVAVISERLAEAAHAIYRASRAGSGQLARDTVAVHRRLLRTLELLSVPPDVYDGEAKYHWGVSPLTRLVADCERFRDACRPISLDVVRPLNEAAAALEAALDELRTGGVPLWSTLANVCVEQQAAEEARLLLFQSRAAKEMFLFAMLARFDVAGDDLRKLNVEVLDLDDLGREWRLRQAESREQREMLRIDPGLRWRPLLIGMPSGRTRTKLSPALLQASCEILIYPHHAPSIDLRVGRIMSDFDSTGEALSKIIANFRGCPVPSLVDERASRFGVAAPSVIDIGAQRASYAPPSTSLWSRSDVASEIESLFADADEFEEEAAGEDEEGESRSADDDREPPEEWCPVALELNCEGGWRVLFATDDEINVVTSGPTGPAVDVRYVRSIRPRDRIVLIHGQRRQSLYQLIVSRIHRDPAIELHLALVRRWQDDLITAFERWRHGGGTVDTLLQRMRDLGSSLVSPLTIRHWLGRKTIAPDSPDDLARLAQALDLSFVREHYRRIDRAAARLRGLHRGLAIRLNRWLEQQATGASGSDDDIFDEELGLRFSDFRDSLLIVAVNSVDEVQGPFLRSHLGKVERRPQ